MINQIIQLFFGAAVVLLIAGCDGTSKFETTDANTTSESTDDAGSMDNAGSIKIAELVENPGNYEGKTVQISGKCVKVNSNIMGKNWIHIQDGSKDDFDMIITTDGVVAMDQEITMTGIVALDKDFGAGYKYDIILEEGKMVQ